MRRCWMETAPGWGVTPRLAALLGATFAFNLGAAAWPAVVAGRLTQDGQGAATLGALFAACEMARLPAVLLLPLLTLRFGPRRVALGGLLALAALPLLALGGLDGPRSHLALVLSAPLSLAVHVALPAFVLAAAGPRSAGSSLAWLGLAGGGGGALGPWLGGSLADLYGPMPALALYALGSLALLPLVGSGTLPAATSWAGWRALLGRRLPWLALATLALASAADAGRAALVPTTLVAQGLPLGEAGFLLGVGAAAAGVGFVAFGALADRAPASRVLAAGLVVLVLGSLASSALGHWPLAYVVAASVLGMGASGIRLGAQVALMDWLGRDSAAVAAAWGEVTVLGGRMLGAPTVGALGETHGGAYAFGAMGVAGALVAALALWVARLSLPLRRLSGAA